ncbi:hypothetical protein [Streptomyces globisporus]|uniref:hypothetical protein n=1 Tax=Streptomyces globisporus TaxID=1908 RepID=UPI00131EB359|nr:hypothetical protein [Streptomyces globisporus]
MSEELPDPRILLTETDWFSLEHAGGPASPDTPAKLECLQSSDAIAATVAIDHLWNDLLHQGSLYSATPPAAKYVAAVLSHSCYMEGLTASQRTSLLSWVAEVSYAVGVPRQRQLEEWFGPNAMHANPLHAQVQSIRPILFQAVSPYVQDSNPSVMEAALLAVVHLLDAPENKHHRRVMSPKIKEVLAVSSQKGCRDAAIYALESWGEDVQSLKDAAEPAREDEWGSFWNSGGEIMDEPPF